MVEHESAFPVETGNLVNDRGSLVPSRIVGGLTKREYFLAHVISGLLANPEIMNHKITEQQKSEIADLAAYFVDKVWGL